MKTAKMLALTALALGCSATIVNAARPGRPGAWRIIGYKIVGAGTDHDVIRVRGEQRDRQLKLCAINRAIHMVDFKVIFANGGRQDVPVRSMVAAGSCTRDIDLKGQGRNIREVRLAYERLDRRAGVPLIRVMAR
ncbi:MAG: hypothetical protein U5M50_13725 [Sphingobium sp.]|nr:hypothetical protein [Sphingobium sp.]